MEAATNYTSSRFENIVRSIIDGTPYPPFGETIHSREEELLLELKEAIEQSGGDIEHLTPEQIAELINKLNNP